MRLRRALAIALAMAESYAEQTGLVELKRQNLEGPLPKDAGGVYRICWRPRRWWRFIFANATAFLLATHASEVSVEIGAVEEVLTDNARLALHGALWELDQELGLFAKDEPTLVATVLAYAEQLMEKVALRARPRRGWSRSTRRLTGSRRTTSPFRASRPARKAKGTTLTMTFKKPHEVVGNHIAKYQAMKLAKMLMAYDFDRKLNPFAELGGFIFTFMGDGKPGTGKTTLIQMMAGLINDYCEDGGLSVPLSEPVDREHRQLSGQVGAERQGLHQQRAGSRGDRLRHHRRYRPARGQARRPAVLARGSWRSPPC